MFDLEIKWNTGKFILTFSALVLHLKEDGLVETVVSLIDIRRGEGVKQRGL